MSEASADEAACLACGVRFMAADRVWYCERCGAGPLCRYCLILRHVPRHDGGGGPAAVRRLFGWLGWRRSRRDGRARGYGRRRRVVA